MEVWVVGDLTVEVLEEVNGSLYIALAQRLLGPEIVSYNYNYAEYKTNIGCTNKTTYPIQCV